MLAPVMLALGAGALAGAPGAGAAGDAAGKKGLRKVRFGANWLAQAEHGGFYQAVADGTYAQHGLDVEIIPGGPQSNNRLLLAVGKLDFYMGGNMLQPFSAVEQGLPVKVVAAIFQKDPQVLMSHPGVGLDRWEDLKNASAIYVGREGLASYYQWLKAEHGFREENTRPYAHNLAPFLADRRSVNEGYATSEPLAVEKQGGFRPNVFLLADHGFDTYSTTIEAHADRVAKDPDLVQRFVDASIIGWRNYLHGDNAAANALILRDNPDMTQEQIDYSVARMKEYGVVESGEALALGIGAMTDARMERFFRSMVKAGLFRPDLDYRASYTLQFVNRGLGLGPSR
ncbi:ABC transporter substrate-binding protein [Camelimonas abortus]|uniref:ABC transporter substrate-binding protein n=2 Tax=Camelimonas abortus TaxID=1017184 RepID=A0ABV7LEC7_9HYPH